MIFIIFKLFFALMNLVDEELVLREIYENEVSQIFCQWEQVFICERQKDILNFFLLHQNSSSINIIILKFLLKNATTKKAYDSPCTYCPHTNYISFKLKGFSY